MKTNNNKKKSGNLQQITDKKLRGVKAVKLKKEMTYSTLSGLTDRNQFVDSKSIKYPDGNLIIYQKSIGPTELLHCEAGRTTILWFSSYILKLEEQLKVQPTTVQSNI